MYLDIKRNASLRVDDGGKMGKRRRGTSAVHRVQDEDRRP
jgi:hypothetical protein